MPRRIPSFRTLKEIQKLPPHTFPRFFEGPPPKPIIPKKEPNSAPHLYEGEPRSLYSGEPTRARGVEAGMGKETTNTNVSRESDTGSGYSGNSGVPERVSHYVMTHPYIFSPKSWSVDTDIEGIQQILDDDHKDEQTIPSSKGHENKQFLHGGYCYREKNYAGAAADFRIAAGQGHAGAQCALGIFYFNGVGVNTSKTEAVGWFIRSAEQGFAGAQFSLGVCYYCGAGVDRSKTEAVGWFIRAAGQGHVRAQYNLGVCYAKGDGVREDYTEAVKWLTCAAKQGDAKAQYALGGCYVVGRGVPENYTEAVMWYRKSAEQGFGPAREVLNAMGL